MASVELLCIGKGGGIPCPPGAPDWDSGPPQAQSHSPHPGEALPTEKECVCERLMITSTVAAPRKASGRLQHGAKEHIRVCCDEELETSFTYVDENVNLRLVNPMDNRKGAVHASHKPSCNGAAAAPVSNNTPLSARSGGETLPELSLLSDEDLFSEAPGGSVDYGFISAVTFLVTGISLVIVSYAVPRQVRADPESVSAREMEQLEAASAQVGAHLDRCVIAGLCLLTLGGVVLSSLLMVSLWKGEMYRRRAFACSKRSAKLYGSTHLRTRSSPSHCSTHLSLDELEEETAT